MLSSLRSSISIFGATGSIGQSTLDVIRQHPDRFNVYGLTAYSQIVKLAEQAYTFDAQCVVVPDLVAQQEFFDSWSRLRPLKSAPRVLLGPEGLVELAQDQHSQVVMAAIVGAAGLPSVLAAAQSGKRILLANKEALVVAGELFMRVVKDCGAEVLPIDSEHNAIFQCLSLHDAAQANAPRNDVKRLILTASGGPFRYTPVEQLTHVTPEQACAHPNWDMGKKISVDSATMLNKGLEVIEAHWLFNMPKSKIDVLIHPQSVVHSMVEYIDGSVVAQLGVPDMRTPIAYGLGFPERLGSGVDTLNLLRCGPLEFLDPDLLRYPCLKLAFSALELGQWACISLNAANEVAVDAFLNRQLPYLSIPKVIEATIEAIGKEYSRHVYERLEDLLEIDNAARLSAKASLTKYGFEG